MSSAISGTESASSLQTDFLNLLVTQMKDQNPLDPMDSSQMTAQLAQLSELQQMENLNSNFAQVLTATQITQANDLIGRQATYTGSDGTAVTGTVSAVNIDTTNGVMVQIGDQNVPVGYLQSITSSS